MKKLMVLILTLIITLSLAACGGEDAAAPQSSVPNSPEPIDLIGNIGNGLYFELPSDIEYVQTDENSGTMIFSNEERTAVVSLGTKTEEPVTSSDITDEVLFGVLSANGALSDATLDRSNTVEQDGGTAVVGFGKVTLEDGTVMNSVIQYFFPEDGGWYHVISYLYAVDAESSLDDMIEQVLSTVKAAEQQKP